MLREVESVVIGAGAAGLMCAMTLGHLGKSVLVLDHANKPGKKILMSGGGRCNFTNYWVEPSNYLSNNPHFCKSALSRYTPFDFISLVDKHQIPYHEKEQGQLFCDNQSKDILDMLLTECQQAGVRIEMACSIEQIKPVEKGYHLSTSTGDVLAQRLVIATGGLSIPTMGATGFGYQIAEQFGLALEPVRAGLVPFTFSGKLLERFKGLSGVSLPARVNTGDQSFTGGLLFTHRGLSGPAILQLSSYWQTSEVVGINFLPDLDLVSALEAECSSGNNKQLKTYLATVLPSRLVDSWLEQEAELVPVARKAISKLTLSEIRLVAAHFQEWQCLPSGTEGYRTAEVTLGGISTNEVSSKTFEAKKAPGLYFIGEVLDVTGWLGGFNFQWAWASGHCCALAIDAALNNQ